MERVPCFHYPQLRVIMRAKPNDFLYETRLLFMPFAVIVAALLLYPEIQRFALFLRAALAARRSQSHRLSGACLWLMVFVFYFGNRQFGGFDFSILIDHGWRLVQGQIPYRDFVCTMPRDFFSEASGPFDFGVRWDAILYATGLFAAGAFLWIYALLRRIIDHPIAAFFTALSVESASNLLLCFWGYNNITTISATLFFLSCVLYLKHPRTVGRRHTYVASLAVLGLMKPQIAGLAGALRRDRSPPRPSCNTCASRCSPLARLR